MFVRGGLAAVDGQVLEARDGPGVANTLEIPVAASENPNILRMKYRCNGAGQPVLRRANRARIRLSVTGVTPTNDAMYF